MLSVSRLLGSVSAYSTFGTASVTSNSQEAASDILTTHPITSFQLAMSRVQTAKFIRMI